MAGDAHGDGDAGGPGKEAHRRWATKAGNSNLEAPGSNLQAPDCNLQAPDCNLEAPDSNLQAAL